MPKKILVMGLPGAGKTTLSKFLVEKLNAAWLNADEIRKKFNDWDFSEEGRIRQAKRMKDLSDNYLSQGKNVVADFICPTPKTRQDFDADFIIWMDTIKSCKFEDTNVMFVPPDNYDLRVTSKDAPEWTKKIISRCFSISFSRLSYDYLC